MAEDDPREPVDLAAMFEEEALDVDDLDPTSAEPFEMPQDESKLEEESAERSMVFDAGRPLINEILAWFDDEIIVAESMSSLNVESRVELAAQVLAAQTLSSRLRTAQANLQAKMDEYLPPVK